MLERLHGEDREKWLRELEMPLTGASKVDPDGFDDSFNQIHQN